MSLPVLASILDRALSARAALPRIAAATAAVLVLLSGGLNALALSPELTSISSHSGQFIVQAERRPPSPRPGFDQTARRGQFSLDPKLVAVSC